MLFYVSKYFFHVTRTYSRFFHVRGIHVFSRNTDLSFSTYPLYSLLNMGNSYSLFGGQQIEIELTHYFY